MSTDKDLPSFWRFVWLLFMMPISLRERLQAIGIDPNASAIQLLYSNKALHYRYFSYQAILLIILMPPTIIIVSLLLQNIELLVGWKKIDLWMIQEIISGVTIGATIGVAVGITIGIANDGTEGVVGGITLGFLAGIVFGVLVGEAVGIGIEDNINRVAFLGAFLGALWGAFWGAFWSVVGEAFWIIIIVVIIVGIIGGGIAGGVIGILSIVIYLRLPIWLLECAQHLFLNYFSLSSKQRIKYSTIFCHELSYLPLPFLGRMIEDAAKVNHLLARQALSQCTKIVGQKSIGRQTLIKLQLQELDQYFQNQQFLYLYELNGEWLPNLAPDNPEVLRQISEIGRFLNSYQLSNVSTQKKQHLQQARQRLQGLQNRLLKEDNDWSKFTLPILNHWQIQLETKVKRTTKIESKEVLNPFYFSKPLNPEIGSEMFRGREATIQQLERLLCDSRQSLSIVLLAPRRCGKSSLLKMLPQLLPQAIFVFYDLQDNPAEHIQGFFHSLITQVKTQAYVERSIKLPDIPSETNLSQSDAWFKQIDQQLTQPLLICIDEFERLPTLLPHLLPNENNDLLRLMGWFRATIQHRRNVRLLISGAAAFDELDRIWDDHFINLQTIKLPHLSADVCLDLLRQPTANFPTDAMPPAVAEYIIERTQGQPYLTQALAGTGIEYINYRGLKQLELSLMDAVEQQVLERCGSYFRDVYYNAPNAAQQLFYRLSHGEKLDLGLDLALDLSVENKAAVRWLQRRLLITEAGKVNIPLFARWVRDWAHDQVEMD